MRVLIDTNLAFSYVTGREDPFSSEIDRIMELCSTDDIEGVLAYHSLSTIWYLMRKAPDGKRREIMRELCELMTLSGADNETVLAAIDDPDFKDFEDAMQDCCAMDSKADYIITANIKDFEGHSKVPALTPRDFLSIILNSDTSY